MVQSNYNVYRWNLKLFYCHPQHFADLTSKINQNRNEDIRRLTSFTWPQNETAIKKIISTMKPGYGIEIYRECPQDKDEKVP